MRWLLLMVHRWIGVILCAYVAMICLTGSVLVYRPELYRHFEPQPIAVAKGGRLLSDDELLRRAQAAFPSENAVQVWRGAEPHHAVEIDLESGDERRNYLFDPYTGEAVGHTLPLGFRATAFVLRLHTELVGGETGRVVNAALGLALAFIALSGVLIWRPQKRSQPARPRRRGLRQLHKTVGIFAAVFVFMWGLTGFHLGYPLWLEAITEHFEPFDETSLTERVGDRVSNWLAYLHFGRFGGLLPGCQRGESCAETLKAAWALIALFPAFLALSGTVLWLRGRRAKARLRG